MTDDAIQTLWKVRDGADGPWLTQNGQWTRLPQHIGVWETVEEAARKVLLATSDAVVFERCLFVEEIRQIKGTLKASDILPPPENTGVVSSDWLRATGSWNARYLLNTGRLVSARNVDPADLPAVVEIFNQVSERTPFRR